MYPLNRITAGLTAVTLAFGIAACDDRSPSGPSEQGPSNAAPEVQPQIGQVNAGNLIAALNNVAVEIDELNALNDLTIGDINIVNVEDVLNNARVLNNSRFLNNIAILQDFLNNSLNNVNVQILNDALNNLDLVLTDVIAIDVLSGGDINVYVQ